MIAQTEQGEPIDLGIMREVRDLRDAGVTSDNDRIVFFAPDEPIRLHSAFGHGADNETFNGIVAANFHALNPRLAAS